MRASNFNLDMEVTHHGVKYRENRPAPACVLCGGKPVLYTVGKRGWCGKCKEAAYQAAKESREP